jgi:phosphate butyryltransferase
MPQKPINTFEQLLEAASRLPETRIVVVAPANVETFEAIRISAERFPARFILAGDTATIRNGIRGSAAAEAKCEILHQPDARDALVAAIELLTAKEADLLLKGSIDTATLMRAVLDERAGLRTGRLLSDVFLFEYPRRTGNRIVMITDGGLTPAPDLKNKVELIQNAVEVAHALGNPLPKVAILSASEFVTPGMPSSVDAAALTKMNDRGQIKGCVVDGPLALDNAMSPEAVEEKGIRSAVAGQAEILIAPTIEAANCLAKSTTLFAGYRLAHVIQGSRVPILIPSRADRSDAKLLSVALGMMMSEYRNGPARA